jgi:hypothetical protein
MKPLIVLLAICSVGYVVDHWQELTNRHQMMSVAEPRGLIIYGNKSSGACVLLEGELNKRGIAHQRKDLGNEANSHELTEKLARVGKMGGSIAIPVAEIDGVLIEGVSIEQITKRLH